MFFPIFWARVIGAKFILIETFARFDRPSLFGRIAAPFAQYKIVQSAALAAISSRTLVVCDPLEVLDGQRAPKKPLLFVTVGTTLPFDRMVEMVSMLKARGDIPEDVVWFKRVWAAFRPRA